MSVNMPSDNHPQYISFGLKVLSAAVASAVFLLSNVHAAGLGKLTVLSSLGQPLRAEIELTAVSKDEIGSLVAKLASSDSFRQAKIDFNPALLSLRFAIEQRGSRQFIRVTSNQPVNEPFVDMLLELGGSNGRLIREYTFLLDPADLRMNQPVQVASPTNVPLQFNTSVAQVPAVPMPPVPERQVRSNSLLEKALPKTTERTAASKPATEVKFVAKPGEYRIRRGDTLTHFAIQAKPSGVSLDQMLVALYRANPNAFAGNNMNRLRTGQILSVPDADAVRSISQVEASGVIVAQAADFDNYRNQLAGKVASTVAKPEIQAKQLAAGKIVTKVEESKTEASEAKDKLKLSRANAVGAGTSAADKVAGATKNSEDKIAKDKAIADANERVKELEKNVNNLQAILEVKNNDLAAQQKKAEAVKLVEKSAASASASVPALAPASAVDSASVAPVAPVATLSKPKAQPQKVKQAQPTEPSFVDTLLDNPALLPGAGVLLALLGALGIYVTRRKKKAVVFDNSALPDSSLKANSLFGSTGGQSVDTNNSVFNSNFTPSASQLDANEVDPIAEADVYIAYGRDAQAEEILKEALRTQPDRNAVRVKLLEIYAKRKDLRSFETLASELFGSTKGEGDDWQQAAALGMAIDPNNPLYAGGELSDDVAAKAVAFGAPTRPLEDLDPESLLANSQSREVQGADIFAFEQDLIASAEAQAGTEITDDLDFDIDLVAQSAASDGLDFDLGGAERQAEVAPEADLIPMSSGMAEISPDSIETVDIEIAEDVSSAPVGVEDVPVAVATLSTDAAEKLAEPVELKLDLDAIDFDFLSGNNSFSAKEAPATPDPHAATAKDVATAAEVDAGAVMDVGAMEMDPAAEPIGAAMEFDLSGIDFDLDSSVVSDQLAKNSAESIYAMPVVEMSGNVEMATKLDLAVAYQEIGDKEGARELLDEVLKDGSSEQIEKAKSLLASLA